MEQVSGLYNPGFLGSQFHWWLGQVANSGTWRDNQPNSFFLFRKDIPGWGYRYKVRIMGIHDAGEAIIPSDQLPWAQVMYPITAGGGHGGSFQSPGIKQGNFVFGFFLDGADEQIPIIMGVLGNNAKTVIGEISSKENDEKGFGPKSGYDSDTTIAADDQLMTEEPSSVCTIESSDANNKENCADKNRKEVMDKETPLECPKHGNTLTSMATHMSNFQKDYQKLMSQLNDYGTAAASKNIITNLDNVDEDQIQSKIDELIDKTSGLSAKSLLPSLNNTQNFLSEKISGLTKTINDAASITDRLDNLKADVEAQSKLSCVFNKIKGDLARLIAAGIRKSLAKKQNRTPQNNNQVRPTGNNSGLIPPLPPEGFYTPSNPCETEDLIADVFSNVMGDITQGYQDVITTLAPGSGTPKKRRLVDVLSQENVLVNLENGNLFGGLASALGAGIGISANQSGAITSALKAGNYAAALTSLVDFSGRSAAIGGLSTAIQSIDNGDIVGAFQGIAGPLGIDSKLMGAVGASLGAITNGDIGSLTNALGNLGGAAPQILTDVLGGRLPLSGIDIGGFGALGGLDFDLALASTFMSTAAAFLECDPPDECPANDTHTLGGGGKNKDESTSEKVNSTNVIDKVKENTVPEGAFGISERGQAEALNNRINAASNITGIPEDLPEGSFGISEAARAEALANRREVITNRIESQTGISGDLPEGSFGISEAARAQALNNRIQSQTGIPANLPEGSFTITPKKKFNVPKIEKVIQENTTDSFGNTTSIEYTNTFPEGEITFSGQESTTVERDGNEVTVKKRKKISQTLSGTTGFDLQAGKPYLLGVEVSFDDYNEYINTPLRDQDDKIREILSRY